MSEFSTRLHLRRKELGLSQEELAQFFAAQMQTGRKLRHAKPL